MIQLYNTLLQQTIQTSKFETRRNYVSLSNIIKPVNDLLNDYYNGYSASEKEQLKCRLGYYMEAGLKDRLLKLPGVLDSYEVVVPDSKQRIKGHTDFLYEGCPGDCKSFALDAYMPKGRLSAKIFWQMNAYMLYMGKRTSVVVAESRESGLIEVIEVRVSDNICNQIHVKVKEIISIVCR